MKRRKELLWFLIPFVLLPVCSAFGTFRDFQQGVPQFMDAENYLRLLWADPLFWVSVGNSLLMTWLTGGVLGAVLGALVLLLRRRGVLSRPLGYVVVFGATALLATAVWIISLRLFPDGYNWLYFIQLGNAAAFFVWLAERIWTAVKKPKQEVETR